MIGLPERWSTPATWPRVGTKYVHVCDAASQLFDVLYGDTQGVSAEAFIRHVSQIIGDWCRDEAVPSYILPKRTRELLYGHASDWIGGTDRERVAEGYVQRPSANGGKLWVYCDVYLGRDAFIARMGAFRKAKTDECGNTPVDLPQPPRGKQGKAMLQRFYERLQAGETQPTSTAEYNAICTAWGNPKEAPSKDTWDRVVGPYWHRLTYSAGRHHIDPQTAAHLEQAAAG